MDKIVKIPLTKGKFAIVDLQDSTVISHYKWHFLKTGYAATSVGGRKNKKMIYMHRLLMSVTDRHISVDHINKDKLDNRRSNLRICTHRQNCSNSSKSKNRKTSIYKGVYFDKERQLWQAKIKVNYKNVYLGRFPIETQAAKAYNNAALKYFGIFASVNEL